MNFLERGVRAELRGGVRFLGDRQRSSSKSWLSLSLSLSCPPSLQSRSLCFSLVGLLCVSHWRLPTGAKSGEDYGSRVSSHYKRSCQKRPSMCQKRPSMCQKRPSMCQKRPSMCKAVTASAPVNLLMTPVHTRTSGGVCVCVCV
jgi:hypothetical protein